MISVLLDFTNAFGSVDHNRLIQVLKSVKNSQLLFSVFINNITKYIKTCKTILFADDKIDETIQIINEEIRNIEQFCKDYGVIKKSSA